ncbi:MAG: biotin/lipoyl-binding protein, partial [Caulobacteraceae bacterium]|nr:biotin/lipoyl-binding protein [Caulobacteraceae bacterium]
AAYPFGDYMVFFEAENAFAFHDHDPGARGAETAGDGSILSPMPGKIVAVSVKAGEAVTKGQAILTLEAMKMEHVLPAPFDGVVGEMTLAEGDQVTEGVVLLRILAG